MKRNVPSLGVPALALVITHKSDCPDCMKSQRDCVESQRDSNQSAQGCEERATLGQTNNEWSTLKGLRQHTTILASYCDRLQILRKCSILFNPVRVGDISGTASQGCEERATLGQTNNDVSTLKGLHQRTTTAASYTDRLQIHRKPGILFNPFRVGNILARQPRVARS